MKTKKILSVALCLCALFLCWGCSSGKKEKESSKEEDENLVSIVTPEDGPESNTQAQAPSANEENLEKATQTPKAPTPPESENSVSAPPTEEEPEPEATLAPSLAGKDLDEQVAYYLENMSPADKVAQMFIVTPESVTDSGVVTMAGEQTKAAIDETPLGGFVYLAENLQTPDQVKEMLSNVQQYSLERTGLPMFTCIDEEGGSVARLNGNPNFNLNYIGNMSDVGSTGDVNEAYAIGQEIGGYLRDLGFNVDFAPVADVLTNPDNNVVQYRSFGSDPLLVADMASAVFQGLRENNVLGAFKHFPGHGATEGDSHTGAVTISKSWEELQNAELIPFQRGIEEEVDFIMVGHISAPNIIGDDTPSSMSFRMITEKLRDEMGYDGLIITDAMNMGAIDQLYSPGDAAKKTIQSGTDIVLMPSDFAGAYQAVLSAVNTGSIPQSRIDDSVARILKAKLRILEKMPKEPAPLE